MDALLKANGMLQLPFHFHRAQERFGRPIPICASRDGVPLTSWVSSSSGIDSTPKSMEVSAATARLPRSRRKTRHAAATLVGMRSEPRWPATIAVLAVGGIYLAIPEYLSLGPRWLLLVVMVLLAVPTLLAHRAGLKRVSHWLGITISLILTADLIWSLGLLVHGLPLHKQAPRELLLSAAALWTSNVLVFALWYWRLDSVGPAASENQNQHCGSAFLFPQMMMQGHSHEQTEAQEWSANFVDYLFIAFNTSTAFSPTDTPPLTRWAKGLMMVQSAISLLIVALLAARAVNIL